MTSSADPDQLASNLDLQCLQRQDIFVKSLSKIQQMKFCIFMSPYLQGGGQTEFGSDPFGVGV